MEIMNLSTPKTIRMRISTLSQISSIDEPPVDIALRAGDDQNNPSTIEANKTFVLLFIF